MTARRFDRIRRLATAATIALATAIGLAGCDSPAARFRLNAAYGKKMENKYADGGKISSENARDVATALEALFGTPDDPAMPEIADPALAAVVDIERLAPSAGRVGSDEQGRPHGLFREHCVHCHGIGGDGAGPTAAFLNPYPRDFRMGKFKFTSTADGVKPAHEDLVKTLKLGIPGTAMPSFALLSEFEIESLTHYLKYLSVRGEVERRMLEYIGENLSDPNGEGASKLKPHETRLLPTDESPESVAARRDRLTEFRGMVEEILTNWVDGKPTAVPADPVTVAKTRTREEAIDNGRKLFFSTKANCYNCHGNTALGDGQTDFDEWSGDWVDKDKPELTADYVALGALEPRKIRPRNLRGNVFRGGRRPIDIYWRITGGIKGSKMPAVKVKADDAGPAEPGLTNQEIWDLVHYVRDGLPYESISDPFHDRTVNLKSTN